jgi:hypothetical protein
MQRTTLAVVFIAAIAALASVMWLQVLETEKALPDVAWNNEAKKSPQPTLGREIREWMLLPWRDANGSIPAGRTAEALAAREEYLNSGLDADGFGELAVSHLRWRSHGPNNIGGRTRQVIVHPTRSDILWAAAIGGGVWKSTDRGETWTATNGGLENYVVSSLALDPNSGPEYGTLYAGTGEGGHEWPRPERTRTYRRSTRQQRNGSRLEFRKSGLQGGRSSRELFLASRIRIAFANS